MLHRANSSSCGWSQPATMLSIGRCAGSRNLQARLHAPARHQKMVRREAGVGVGKRVPRVEHQQFVQQGRAGSPMADHENRIVLDLRSVRSSAREGRAG